MSDILRDPLWQFIGAAIAFAAVVATIAIFISQRRRKQLSYEVISSTPLLSMREELEGKVSILFGDTPVQRVHLLIIRFENSGNVPIPASDYERPLSISLGADARILSAEITDVTPASLSVDFSQAENGVVFQPVLLNPKDAFAIKILVSDVAKEIHADSRILGVHEIRREDGRATGSLVVAAVGSLIAFAGLAISFGIEFIDRQRPAFESTEQAISVFAVMVGYVLMVVGLYRNRRSRERLRDLIRRVLPF